mgnify:CR=1 FL=1
MEKTLHILPCKPHWAWFAYDWIGSERDTHDVLRYPVQTNVHYLPEDFSEVEMMKVAISWGDPKLYEDLKVFAQKLSEIQNYEKVVVWHAEDPDSRLLFCTVVSVVRQALYEIDITPEDRRTQWKQTIEDEPETERDVNVFCVGQVGIDVTRASYSMKPVTEKMRERLLTEWRRWGGKMLRIAQFWSTSMGNYSTRIVHICTGTFLSSLRKLKRYLSQRLPNKSSINIHNCGISMSVTLWLRWPMRE